MNGVIYARYSSHNQREESIEGQIRECKRYAEQHGITIVGEYADRAITGRTDERVEFQKMIRDAEKGHFQVVLVYKLDRFARNRYDSATYRLKLKKCGVKIASAMEAVQDGPEGIILEAVLEGMAEYYSANLSQNIKRGMTDNAMKCLATGGGRCLGYKTGPDKKYVIDPPAADTVRLIYEMYDQGHTYAHIVETLNNQGRTTFKGTPFNKNSLGKILHNRRYIGDYVWGDIVVAGGMPQIVDRDLWERVQAKLSRKEKASARARGDYNYILSGKLFCGKCGKGMIGDHGTSRNGAKFYYYTCSTKKHGGSCSKKSVRAEKIEAEVIRTTIQTVLQDDMIEYIADRVMEYQAKDTEGATLLSSYNNRLKETEMAINGILKAIEDGLYTATMKERMGELEAQKEDLKASISREEINDALTNADPGFVDALLSAVQNITAFHERQKQQSFIDTKDNGVILGSRIRGLTRVGIYVPGGTAAYPSSVLMNAIPARIAGVKEIIMVTPPTKDGKANPDILVAAAVCGVDRIFLLGGAQAVAALACGTESVPKVDKIVGPGNIFVATAKKLLFGEVDIDMVAGPSEILILADETANPVFLAADLLSQAEHDKLASAILITTSERIAESTAEEVSRQAKMLSRREIIEESLENYGAVFLCETTDEAVRLANELAPEHLEVSMKDPMRYVGRLDNAGSIFLGEYSPEPLGDYYAGPNHVLPTSGTARFFSPLSVDSFVKKSSFLYYTAGALQEASEDIVLLAQKEGLTAHANSILVRRNG